MTLEQKEDANEFFVCNKLSIPQIKVVEPVGRWFEAHCLRRRHRVHSRISHQSLLDSSFESLAEDDDDEAEEGGAATDEELGYLQSLNPKDWKDQDHYMVLGLHHLRYKATEEDIKKAYKRKVLYHHPDKRANTATNKDDDYFTCITRAYEILGHPIKRRSYDSIDPEFDDNIPRICATSRDDFFVVFRDVFKQNARWSTIQPAPDLGDENSTFEEVDQFYAFWYDFDSWREFSYLDEDDKEKGENREERRWIEKQNKSARQKRKKEEIARIRTLIDNAYACDPRIQKFKEDEKRKKEIQKQARAEAAKQRAEEEEMRRKEMLEAEHRRRQEEEEEAKAQAALLKKEKETQKKILKRERKSLRTLAKQMDYFSGGDETAAVINMGEIERLCDLMDLTVLQSLNEVMNRGDEEESKCAFKSAVQLMNEKLEREKAELLAASQKTSSERLLENGGKKWSEEDINMLIKAVNLFPAGTNDRWEVVAAWVAQHSSSEYKHSAKEALIKAKTLQRNDLELKVDANKKAFEHFQKEQKHVGAADEAAPSARYDGPAELQGLNPAPWTSNEQKLLEQALKTFPSNTPDRWDKIAETIPNRSKKDCMKRYKELAEMVKAKKMVQAAAAKTLR